MSLEIPTLDQFAAMERPALVALDPHVRMHLVNDLTRRTQEGENFSREVRMNVIRLMEISRNSRVEANPYAKKSARKEAAATLDDFSIEL